MTGHRVSTCFLPMRWLLDRGRKALGEPVGEELFLPRLIGSHHEAGGGASPLGFPHGWLPDFLVHLLEGPSFLRFSHHAEPSTSAVAA